MAGSLMLEAQAPEVECAGRDVDEILRSRLLATFAREVGGGSTLSREAAPEVYRELSRHGRPVCFELPATGFRLMAALARCSPSGHHQFAGVVTLHDGACWRSAADPALLAEVLTAELSERERRSECAGMRGTSPVVVERGPDLCQAIAGSVQRVRQFAGAALARPAWTHARGSRRCIEAEQSLVFGHPFHPAPKSGEGAGDLDAYRPELGASFQLEYFAVAPDLLLEDALGERLSWEPDVGRVGHGSLAGEAKSWPLLPVHPWQAARLEARDEFSALRRRGRLIRLGPLGEHVFPTSSVRTVYAPIRDLFIKLPLDAKITNFVRNNPVEHLERSLTASRVVQRIARGGELESLEFLPELAYRGIRQQAWPAGAEQTASVSVLFRRGLSGAEGAPPVVVAALLEPPVGPREAPIAEVLWTAARAAGRPLTAALVGDWVARYCEVALVPLLGLFCRYGVSLEAHVQNALIALEEGWPSRLFIRDLEGTTLSRSRAPAPLRDLVPSASSIWVEDEEAWRRLMYYVIVNHVAHLLATLAEYGPAEEWQLWQVTRKVLEDAAALQLAPGAADVKRLLSEPGLPAKANWSSCLRGTSEKPAYVTLPNPLAAEASGS